MSGQLPSASPQSMLTLLNTSLPMCCQYWWDHYSWVLTLQPVGYGLHWPLVPPLSLIVATICLCYHPPRPTITIIRSKYNSTPQKFKLSVCVLYRYINMYICRYTSIGILREKISCWNIAPGMTAFFGRNILGVSDKKTTSLEFYR